MTRTDPPSALGVEQAADLAARVVGEVEKAVVGKREALDLVMSALLCAGGHVLLEDYPGLAKTLIASAFARALGLEFKRIQFTPDLLPGDITGGWVFEAGSGRFVLRKGPIFTHVLLADEINRASPRTQAALLEAMQERHVTIEGETLPLPEPFIVIATQNPIEYEGTFPLPEAQLDRFIVRLAIGYPTPEEEDEILRRRTERRAEEVALEAVIGPEAFLAMRAAAEAVYVDPEVRRYMVDLASHTRTHRQVVVGTSPRGSLALLKLAKAWAATRRRDYVVPDDVKRFAVPALAHRIVLDPGLWSVRRSDQSIIGEVERAVPVPVLGSRS
jgi:MoxR-like ATPase